MGCILMLSTVGSGLLHKGRIRSVDIVLYDFRQHFDVPESPGINQVVVESAAWKAGSIQVLCSQVNRVDLFM